MKQFMPSGSLVGGKHIEETLTSVEERKSAVNSRKPKVNAVMK